MTEPIDLAVEGADKGVISATPSTRRSVTNGKRAFVVIPAVAVSALLFAGCSADSWPQLAGSPTPSPTESVIVPEDQQAPAVTKAQAERIIARIASTAADADTAMDATLASTRLDGAVLDERATNYTASRRAPRRGRPRGDPDQAARDRAAAGVRRLAALGHGRRQR